MPNEEKTSPEVAKDASRLMRHSDPLVRKVAASALNQAPNKKQYVALTGINFDGLKPPVRIEAGDPIPLGVSHTTIADLLNTGAIKEK